MKKEIKINTAEKELYYKGNVIVKYSIQYPEIEASINEYKKQQFNHLNRKQALKLKQFIEGEFYNQAKETYELSSDECDKSFIIYKIYIECDIE